MPCINHKGLARSYRAGLVESRRTGQPNRFHRDLREGFEKRHVTPRDFSIRQLFEAFVPDGRELADSFNPRHGGNREPLMEAGFGGVQTSDFANITGQIVYSEALQAHDDPQFIGGDLARNVPTQFNGEKIAGIGRVGDVAQNIGEGDEYPIAGNNEEWVETPATIKRGMVVPVTKEAVFFDRTGQVLERAGEVGHFIGVNKEKRILDVALGISTVYRYKGTAAQATYANSHTPGDFDNLAANNALVDWTDIEAAELLFDAITDPNTGEPVMVSPDTIVVPTALKHTARFVNRATENQIGDTTSASVPVTRGPQPTGSQYTIKTNQYVKDRTSSTTTWFIGQFQKAFAYMENWPITVTQAPQNSHDEFWRDIVSMFKASERGAAAVRDPRYAVKNTA